MKKILLLIFSFHFSIINLYSQDQPLVDSLFVQLNTLRAAKERSGNLVPVKSDTLIADVLYQISKAYWGSDPDKGIDFAKQTIEISEKIGYKKGLGDAYNSLGNIFRGKANFVQALDFYKKSLKLRIAIGDKNGIPACYNNIGLTYFFQGNYPEAMQNLLLALKLNEVTGNKIFKSRNLCAIGQVYSKQGNHAEALKFNLEGLKVAEESGDKMSIGMAYTTIGDIYKEQGDFEAALSNTFKAINAMEAIGNKGLLAFSYLTVGDIYYQQNNDQEAMKYYFIALNCAEEINAKGNIATSSYKIGKVYTGQKKFGDALSYLKKSITISKEIKGLDQIKNCYEGLSKLDSAQGNYKSALENYKLYVMIRDSLVNSENTQKITQQQMQFDFDKEAVIQKTAQEKKDALAQQELKKQKLVRNGSIIGAIVFLLLAFAIFVGFIRAAKANKKSEELLLNILPGEVAEELKATGKAKAKSFTMVTVMFSDFKDFTTVGEKISAELLVEEIHTCFSAFDSIMQKYGIEKIKTIGDAYMCASGLPVPTLTHATDMIQAAFEMQEFMLQRKKEKESRGETPFELRIGINTGSVVAGVVGVKKYAYDIWGDTVNLAARMEQNSEAGKINISGSTYEIVKNKFSCIHRGKISAKNKGEVDMYFVNRS